MKKCGSFYLTALGGKSGITRPTNLRLPIPQNRKHVRLLEATGRSQFRQQLLAGHQPGAAGLFFPTKRLGEIKLALKPNRLHN